MSKKEPPLEMRCMKCGKDFPCACEVGPGKALAAVDLQDVSARTLDVGKALDKGRVPTGILTSIALIHLGSADLANGGMDDSQILTLVRTLREASREAEK